MDEPVGMCHRPDHAYTEVEPVQFIYNTGSHKSMSSLCSIWHIKTTEKVWNLQRSQLKPLIGGKFKMSLIFMAISDKCHKDYRVSDPEINHVLIYS